MQKWVLLAILSLLVASFVSAQEITGYIGLTVITPAQSVEATTQVLVDNRTRTVPQVPEIAINKTPENLTPIVELPVAQPQVPETVFTLISKFFSWFRLR